MLRTYCAPKAESRTMKKQLCHKIFISSFLYLCYKFRSSTVTDKQSGVEIAAGHWLFPTQK